MAGLLDNFALLSLDSPEDTATFVRYRLYPDSVNTLSDINDAKSFNPPPAANATQDTVDKKIHKKATDNKRKRDVDDEVISYEQFRNPDNLELFVEKQGIGVERNGKCLALPFIFNDKGGTPAEEKLYEYLKFVGKECDENMIIIHSYEHKGNRGVFGTHKDHNSKDIISETDVIVVHRWYGLMLFEVKAMDFVITAENNKCPLKSIKKGDEQLKSKWNEICNYISKLFHYSRDRERWTRFFDNCPVDDVINAIKLDTRSRSFLCLFNYPSSMKSVDNHISCNKQNCDHVVNCLKVENANWVLTKKDLKNPVAFCYWWRSNIRSVTTPPVNLSKYAYLLMINRFVMDHFHCAWYQHRTSLTTASAYVEKCESVVPKSINSADAVLVDEAKQGLVITSSIYYSVEQMKAIMSCHRELCVRGPAGTGKTIVLIQKVKNLLNTFQNDARAKAGQKILVLCFSKVLRAYLNSSLGGDSGYLTVRNIDRFMIDNFDDRRENDNYPPTFSLNKRRCRIDGRFAHIFIDECQDLTNDLVEFLYENVYDNEKCGHFWLLYDPAQNVQTAGIERFLRTKSVPIKYLNRVYRCCSQQFRFMKPYIGSNCHECAEIELSSCNSQESAIPECSQCVPSCGVQFEGPAPIRFPIKSFEAPLEECAVKWVCQCLQLSWKNYVEALRSPISDKNYCGTVFKVLKDNNCLKRSVVLFRTLDMASRMVNWINIKFGNNIACSADNFIPQPPASIFIRSNYINKFSDHLRIDSFRRFKGLEADVVIVFDPPADENLSAIVYSRATCQTVVVGTAEQLARVTF